MGGATPKTETKGQEKERKWSDVKYLREYAKWLWPYRYALAAVFTQWWAVSQ